VALRFLPPDRGEVGGYLVYASDVDSGDEQTIDLGFVAPEPDGVARATVVLDDARTYRVQMAAYNDATLSPRSNELVIEATALGCDAQACDDGDPCTVDWCEATGCASAPAQDGTSCDDGYADTVDDQCVQGVCEGMLLDCRADAECDDGDVCNGFETCGGAAGCLEGEPLFCGETTSCRAPGCSPTGGCFTDLLPDGTACDDPTSGTWAGVCVAGSCEATTSGAGAGLGLASIWPEAVSPGRRTIEVYGSGFTPGAVLTFENGQGRSPRVRALWLEGEDRLRAEVDVSGKGPRRARLFDVRVTLPDGRTVRLHEGLRIDP
jgi:hypothetical protein